MELTREAKAEKALQSLMDCSGAIAALSGGMKKYDGYAACFAPETFWYNRVRLYANPPAGVEATVREIAAGAKAGTLPPLLGWLDSDFAADAETLPRLLTAEGYMSATTQKAMYLSLRNRAVSDAVPPRLEAMPAAQAELWSEINARAFRKPPDTGGLKLLARRGDADFLLWRENGEIVGGTLLYCAGGNGGIHEVFTLPEYRERGIASALVSRALDLAAGKGCDCATLQASDMGYPVYLRLGFEDVGLIHNWILKK